MAVALHYSLKSESLIPAALFSFLKIALIIWIVCVCVSIQIAQLFVLILWKRPFDGDCIESVDGFG